MKQHEIPIPESKAYTIKCSCGKRAKTRDVVMERALDPNYFKGTCRGCGQTYIEKVKNGTPSA